MKKIFLVLLFFCLVRPAGAAGPLSALTTAGKGIDACDSDLFGKGADLNRITRRAAEDILKRHARKGGDGATAFLDAAAAAGAGNPAQAALIAQLLASEMRSFAVSGINSCLFAGKEGARPVGAGGLFGPALDKMPPGRREIKAGRVLSQDKDYAEVTGIFSDPRAGDFPLVLALERQNGVWRIVEIKNVPELVDRAAGR
ncbi:MAG: hypothetical protein LBQ51_00570 [Desulfovibrio sp.]|jgi:hypothetical protein|nr:hypothetical protein [Desulfovibrio sp.]